MMSIYSFFCWLVFKVFKVPVNKWTLTTAVLGGGVLIISVVLLMNYNHPYTSNARSYFVSTPIVTNVNSQVTSVKVKTQQHVKKGDTLFTLDSTVFVSRYKTLQAARRLAQTRLKQSQKLAKVGAGSTYDIQSYQAEIASYNAQLIEAEYNVRECVVKAPGDGLISQTRLREGMRAVMYPLAPLMTFVDTSEYYVIAAIPQNPMQQLEVGNDAELIFDAIPGVLLKGEVVSIGEVIQQGELQASGKLINLDTPGAGYLQGSVPVRIKITSDISEYFIPGGAKCQAAIYSDHVHHVRIVRKMLLRMKGWTNYVFGEH